VSRADICGASFSCKVARRLLYVCPDLHKGYYADIVFSSLFGENPSDDPREPYKRYGGAPSSPIFKNAFGSLYPRFCAKSFDIETPLSEMGSTLCNSKENTETVQQAFDIVWADTMDDRIKLGISTPKAPPLQERFRDTFHEIGKPLKIEDGDYVVLIEARSDSNAMMMLQRTETVTLERTRYHNLLRFIKFMNDPDYVLPAVAPAAKPIFRFTDQLTTGDPKALLKKRGGDTPASTFEETLHSLERDINLLH